MARLVMKFGGTSVADVDRIKTVARHVKREVDAGNQVAVVVSAMAGTTNQLVAWTKETAALHDAREYDAVVAAGEQVTSGLLAIALQTLGVNARSWQGWQIPIRTDAAHGAARIVDIDGDRLVERLESGQVAVEVTFSTEEAAQIRAFFGSNPQSGAEALPPGIRKNLARGKPLPPGIAKKMLPDRLEAELPVHDGYHRVQVGLDVFLVEVATGIIHDVLMDVIR